VQDEPDHTRGVFGSGGLGQGEAEGTGIGHCFLQQFLGQVGAAAAAGGNAELAAQVFESPAPPAGGFAYLSVCDLVAEADVHGIAIEYE